MACERVAGAAFCRAPAPAPGGGLLARGEVTCFDHDSTLPDPYDGLLDAPVGEPLPVHDCMGVALRIDGRPLGRADARRAADRHLTPPHARAGALRRACEAAIRMTRLERRTRPEPLGSPYAGRHPDEPALRAALDEGEILDGKALTACCTR